MAVFGNLTNEQISLSLKRPIRLKASWILHLVWLFSLLQSVATQDSRAIKGKEDRGGGSRWTDREEWGKPTLFPAFRPLPPPRHSPPLPYLNSYVALDYREEMAYSTSENVSLPAPVSSFSYTGRAQSSLI